MMFRTHMAIGIFAGLAFLKHISDKWIFLAVILISTMLPDIDNQVSYLGRRKIFRFLQFFTKHRGFIHSFTFSILVSIIFAFYLPVLALPFFMGYSLHLIADSWTIDGIRPFWPSKKEVKGKIRVGGPIEDSIFFVFVVLDLMFLVLLFV